MVIDPWSLYQSAKLGYNIAKWLDSPVECDLTVFNGSEKNLYCAICLYRDDGSASMGWIRVDSDDSEQLGVPVPRVGSVSLVLHARTRKGKRLYEGSGHEQRNFYVAMPRYDSPLPDSSQFSIEAAASSSPRLIMNQGGVERLPVVKGTLLSMSGDMTFKLT